MIVPNYVPDPLEVPNNVTLESYSHRLIFVRRVVFAFVLSFLPILVSFFALRDVHLDATVATLYLVGVVIALEFERILLRSHLIEATVASALLYPFLSLIGFVAHQWFNSGFPVWAFLPGPLALALYTALCGRDFSFVAAYFLSIIPSAIGIAVVVESWHMPTQIGYLAHAINAVWLFYVIYDLASLMARRRSNEVFAAVVDLYRDHFNLFGYIPRVINHWRKYRIWTDVIAK